jgi:hypothetical protein
MPGQAMTTFGCLLKLPKAIRRWQKRDHETPFVDQSLLAPILLASATKDASPQEAVADWKTFVITHPWPQYPFFAREYHNSGEGKFRFEIDPEQAGFERSLCLRAHGIRCSMMQRLLRYANGNSGPTLRMLQLFPWLLNVVSRWTKHSSWQLIVSSQTFQ